MNSHVQKFKDLHHSKNLFVLPNAWDARSALIFQEKKFAAVGTSSAAVANSLGYEDGENIPFDEYLFVINRILSVLKIPLTVDVEMGYGTTKEAIVNNIVKLAEIGVAGINIEDSVIRQSKRTLQDAPAFANTIESIKSGLKSKNLDLFINLRCDTYILNVENREKQTIERLKIYNDSGADGIFLPCITGEKDITAAIANSTLPLNVMSIAGLPGIEVLNRLGVKRVSMGPFMFHKVYNNIATLLANIESKQNFESITS